MLRGFRLGAEFMLKEMSIDEETKDKSDEELLALSIANPDLFEVILKRYQVAFLRKARSIIRSREEAEDIVQETFTKIYVHAGSFKKQEGASFKSWAYKILMNTSFTYYKRKRREHERVAYPDPEFFEAMPDLKMQMFEHGVLKDYVASIIARMPSNLARAMELHFIEGRPQSEVAKMEGVSVGAIKTRIHRAKEEFRKINTSLS